MSNENFPDEFETIDETAIIAESTPIVQTNTTKNQKASKHISRGRYGMSKHLFGKRKQIICCWCND